MREQLFLTTLAAIAMMSCSKDEQTEINNGRAIDFRAAMGTRASEMTTTAMNQIYVTALNVRNENLFSNQLFQKENSSSFFVSTPAYHWPGDGSNLTFYAYWPSMSELGGTLEITSTNKQLKDFSPKVDITQQKDFVTIKATGNKTNATAGVALEFQHRLVQIEVKAKNTNTGYTYKVQGVRIGKPKSKGTFDFEQTTWILGSEKTNYEALCDDERTLNGSPVSIMKAEGDNAMLIPQQLVKWEAETDKPNVALGAYLAVKVQINTQAGARVYPMGTLEYDWVAVPIDTHWEAGKKYVYTLDFSNGAGKVDPEKVVDPSNTEDHYNPGDDVLGGVIKFTVSVADWQEEQKDIHM